MVTSLDYAGVYEQVRGDSARSPLRQLTAFLSRSTNLNANLALWSLPGSAPTLGQAFPADRDSSSAPVLGQALHCSSRALPGHTVQVKQALSQLEPAAGGVQLPPPRRQWRAGGELPAPGSRERWM